MGAIFDVPRMELSGIQVFAPADISMHQDVALLATACTNLQTCFNLFIFMKMERGSKLMLLDMDSVTRMKINISLLSLLYRTQ